MVAVSRRKGETKEIWKEGGRKQKGVVPSSVERGKRRKKKKKKKRKKKKKKIKKKKKKQTRTTIKKNLS